MQFRHIDHIYHDTMEMLSLVKDCKTFDELVLRLEGYDEVGRKTSLSFSDTDEDFLDVDLGWMEFHIVKTPDGGFELSNNANYYEDEWENESQTWDIELDNYTQKD